MEFSRQFISTFTFGALLCLSSFAHGTSTELKPACFRIEGTNMSCTGGGGVACGESCDSTFGSKIGEVCESAIVGTICNGTSPTPCYGSKCCDTCEAHQNDRCGTFSICGKTCSGAQQIDCTKQNCSVPVLGTGVPKWTSVSDGCTPGIVCDDPIKAGDGCVCNCALEGQSCVGQDNGRCTKCECGSHGICTPKTKMVCANDTNAQCLIQYNTVPMVNDGPCACKCPSAQPPVWNLPSCGTCT